jgi:anti-anti-sigma regulatory factor
MGVNPAGSVAPAGFGIEAAYGERVWEVRLHGPLDLSDSFRAQAFLLCCARSAQGLNLDVSEVIRWGPAGARALTVVGRIARVHGCQVFLEGVNPGCAVALRAAGLPHLATAALAGLSIGARGALSAS